MISQFAVEKKKGFAQQVIITSFCRLLPFYIMSQEFSTELYELSILKLWFVSQFR